MAWSSIVAPFAEQIATMLAAIHRPPALASPVRSASVPLRGPTVEDVIPDDLWFKVAPLISTTQHGRNGGRPFKDARAVLAGILSTTSHDGAQRAWTRIPPSLGVSRYTCKRGYDEWCASGMWERIERVLAYRTRPGDGALGNPETE
jgi:transposase